jgi:heat shock protein HspQ
MKYYLGDYVKTKRHGHEGRINGKHCNFHETTESDSWFARQSIPIPEEAKDEPWYSILCKNGGAALIHEADLTKVEPFELNNDYWEEFHFGKVES